MKQDRAAWIDQRCNLPYREGFYIFGGQNERDVL